MDVKPYPEYKDSDFNWVPEVPNSWDVVKTKRFCQILTGGTPRKDNLSYWEGGNINWMTSGEVNKRRVKETNNKITKAGLLNSNARILPKNSIMIALSGQGKTKGTVAILDIPTCCSQSLGAYACDENKLHYNYLFYYLTSKYRDIRWLVGDSQREGLSLSIIGDIYTLAPSLKEQVKIGHFLDKKTSEIDLTIEKDTHLIELLKEKRTSIINHVVTKGLDPKVKMKDSGVEWIGEIPEDWEVKKLKHISLVSSDKLNKKPKEIPYIGLEHIQSGNGVLLKNNVEEVDSSVSRFKKGDILFGKLRPYLAKVIEAPFDGVGTTELVVIRMNESINSHFAFYQLLSDRFINLVNALTYGVKMPRANPDQIVNISICVPPIKEQKEISLFLDKETSKIDNIIQKIQEKISLLEEYKKSLIHHVVTGKVDVREVAV